MGDRKYEMHIKIMGDIFSKFSRMEDNLLQHTIELDGSERE